MRFGGRIAAPKAFMVLAGKNSIAARIGVSSSRTRSLRRMLEENDSCLSTKQEQKWNPPDSSSLAVKAALHLSAVPENFLCREEEFHNVANFCKACIEEQKPGGLYVCGCPGTGKTLLMEKVKASTPLWAQEAEVLPPDLVYINCTVLTDPRHIYQKILRSFRSNVDQEASLQQLREVLCPKKSPEKRMRLLIIDEMDYLITRDQAVLYDLFQLSSLQGSTCILIGIANAIDLTERFLPRLRSLNCAPTVITFPAYSKDQILAVLNQRLQTLPASAFHPMALELCARKVAAASGDMRKALYACRTAFETLESEWNEKFPLDTERMCSEQDQVVQVDHMAKALAKIFRSPVIETIQALPKHPQMVLCSAVRLFRNGRKDALLGELNKAYIEFCKSTGMHPVPSHEFSAICQLLVDQGLMTVGAAREGRLKKAKLQVNQDDIVFALQGVRFFRNSLLS